MEPTFAQQKLYGHISECERCQEVGEYGKRRLGLCAYGQQLYLTAWQQVSDHLLQAWADNFWRDVKRETDARAEWKGIEVNGPANILQTVDLFLSLDQADRPEVSQILASVQRQARLTIRYLEGLEVSKGKPWHQIIKEENDHA